MNNNKKRFYIILFTLLFMITLINSITIVEWLNRSLFEDFIINPEHGRNYFYSEVILVFIITIFIYSIIGTFIVSIIATDILFITLIIANHFKVKERNEFITFSELKTITSPKELLSFVDINFGIAILAVVLMLILLVVLQYIIIRVSKKIEFKFNKKARIGFFIVPLLILTFLYFEPHTFNKYVMKFEEATIHNWNPVKRAQADGFIPSFIHTVKPNYQDKPTNYNKKRSQHISEKYENISKKINNNRSHSISDSQTILYLSETLIDPKQISGLLENETPIPNIKRNIAENIGGTMYSQYIGGGTANIEWSILTSFSLEVFNDPVSVTPYSDFYSQSKNHKSVLSYYENNKIAIHPYSAHLYKRKTIYNKLGFDDFLFLDNGIQHTEKIGTYQRVSDEALNKDILRESSKDTNGLIHVLSMQNHSPFNGELPDMTYKPVINEKKFPKDRTAGLYNYLQGLKATDEAINDLINELESADKEINILLYGDHFPSLFTGLEKEIGKEKLHETPWFIYMNKNRSSNRGQFQDISPMFLMTVLLREGEYYVSPFQGLLDELLSNDVRRIGKDFIYTKKGLINDNDLSKELQDLVNDYRFIMYDSLFGNNWLGDKLFDVQE